MAQAGGKRLVVIGGGLAGLSYVHYLRNFASINKAAPISKITLIEANDYMGGSVKSHQFDDGVVHEFGPRSIRGFGIKSKNTLTLIEQLGLEGELLLLNQEAGASRNRFIYNKGELVKFPLSFIRIFSRLPHSKQRLFNAIYKEISTPRINLDEFPFRDPPLYEFVGHRFGSDVAEYVLDPLMRGITSGDARNLSTRALFGDYLEREQAHGSIIKSSIKPPVSSMHHDEFFPNEIIESKLLDRTEKQKIISFNLSSGLQMLPERISNTLLNTNNDGVISIYNQTRVESIKFNTINEKQSEDQTAPCLIGVNTIDGDRVELEADHIIAALPSKDLAKLLPDSMPQDQRQALQDVISIPHSPVACVCVEYRGIQLPKICGESFGLLTHSKAGSKILGISFDSAMFSDSLDKQVGAFRMTCMIGGSWFKEVMGTDNLDQINNGQFEQIALDEIWKILKIDAEPYRMSTLLWKTGIAQYTPGHKERVEQVRSSLKRLGIPLTLLGQSYDGVSVNDVIYSARMAAYNYLKSL